MARERYDRNGLLPDVEQIISATRAAKASGEVPTAVGELRKTDLPGAAYFSIGAPPIALEREITIETPAAPLRALMFAPVAEPQGLPVVVHFHGGGYVFMLPESFAKPCKEIAIGANAIVVSVDYRLAPEHPYPVPVDDSVAAFRWLRKHAVEIGGDPARIALAGESAGGGLAAATTLRLLAEGDQPPAAVVLASAWLDLRNSSASFDAFGPDDAFIDSATMAYWRSCYAPREEQWLEPCASPVLADVGGFPPTCVVVAGIDPLYDDGVAFAERLRAAGRSVELHDFPGMPHIFWCFPQLAGLTDATARMGAFLRRELHGHSGL